MVCLGQNRGQPAFDLVVQDIVSIYIVRIILGRRAARSIADPGLVLTRGLVAVQIFREGTVTGEMDVNHVAFSDPGRQGCKGIPQP